MTPLAEKRALQTVIALAALVPLAMGFISIVRGPAVLAGLVDPAPVDLDSHFRYLSGLLLGIGLAFAACIPEIERRGPIVRVLGAVVVTGGLARLVSLIEVGVPGPGHLFGMAMELGVVPLILIWQHRVAARCDT